MNARRRHATQYFWWGILLWIVCPAVFWAAVISLLTSCRTAKESATERHTTHVEVRHDTVRTVTERVIADTIVQRDTLLILERVVVTADTTGRELHRETTREVRRTTDRDATHATTQASAVSERTDATTLHADTQSARTVVAERPSFLQRIKDNIFVLTTTVFLLLLLLYIHRRKKQK